MFKSIASLSLVLSLILLSANPARAGHHQWDVFEVFSSADGKIQFIELWESTGDNAENGIGPFSIASDANTFNFVTNLPAGNTGFKFVLLATQGFADLPNAVTPDYIIPDNFFSTNGDTIRYAGAVDILAFGIGVLPTNGILSLNDSLGTETNSPTNFAGETMSINLQQTIPSVSKFGIFALAVLIVGVGIVVRQRMRPGATHSNA